jgi:predicted amidohydrolase
LTTSRKLVTVSFDFYEEAYEENLKKLIDGVTSAPSNSIVLAPELCLTNFSFDKMQEASEFGERALEKLKELSKDKIISFSLTTKRDEKFYNTAVLIYDGEIVYQRDKYQLFKFGDEHKYFTTGKIEDVKIVELDGIKFGILICFEIRFIDLWKKLQGVDILLVPALWGVLRKKQLEIISNSLAVINQCYVMISNSKNSDMASSSAIITPFGEFIRDDSKDMLVMDFDKKEITKMRRYMDVGIR